MSQPARPYIGGQALLEGVMMRSPKSFAMVVRRKSGALVVRERPIVDERKGARALPLVRGIATLVESLRLGSEALKFSTRIFEKDLEEEEAREAAEAAGEKAKKKKEGTLESAAKKSLQTLSSAFQAASLAVSFLATVPTDHEPAPKPEEAKEDKGKGASFLMIAIMLVVLIAAPQAAANGVKKLLHLDLDLRSFEFQAITGAMKLAIVIGYMAVIRTIPDIRRVFQYHGAEHKTISAYEAEEDLVVANARSKTTLHPRCGTTFLVMVAMVSVFVFSAISPFLPRFGEGNQLLENVVLFVMKIPFIPVIAGITFEIQRFFARFCTVGPLRVFLWPGFLVQKITTIEPDDAQLEVAISAMKVALWRESGTGSDSATETTFASFDELSKSPGLPAV